MELIEGDYARALVPSDIAVLVRKNQRGEEIRDRLVSAGVPAVMFGASSVFTSPMAQDWLTLLAGPRADAATNRPAGGSDVLLRLDIRATWLRPARSR